MTEGPPPPAGWAGRTRAAWAAPREIRRALLDLALPIVGANLLQRGVGIVDAVLVGHVGPEALAAVGLSNLLLMFVMALVFGLGLGSTVLVAFHTGARDAARRAAEAAGSAASGGNPRPARGPAPAAGRGSSRRGPAGRRGSPRGKTACVAPSPPTTFGRSAVR